MYKKNRQAHVSLELGIMHDNRLVISGYSSIGLNKEALFGLI